MSHFVMMENREGIASSGGFNAMGVEDCLAGCIGTPACPGVIYAGNAFLGQCNFLEKRHFEMGHLTRGGSSQAVAAAAAKRKVNRTYLCGADFCTITIAPNSWRKCFWRQKI